MVIVAISQPTYLPWLGFFDLADRSDVFVFLDDVQFHHRDKDSWDNRNRLKTPRGLEWLTVPVRASLGTRLVDVEFADPLWWERHINAIRMNYARTRYYGRYFPEIRDALKKVSRLTLLEANLFLVAWLMERFGIAIKTHRASCIAPERGARSCGLVALCSAVGAREYLSPRASRDYLVEDRAYFETAGIQVSLQGYEHPTYRQAFPPFASHASALDLLFNEGPASLEVIRSGRREMELLLPLEAAA